jgi:hypothetical protein
LLKEKLETLYSKYKNNHTFMNIAYVNNENNTFATDDDNALYTGIALAVAVKRWSVCETSDSRQDVTLALRGVYNLLNGTPVSGVVCRRVMPLSESTYELFGYHKHRSIARKDSWADKILSGQVVEIGDKVVVLKATKDQITGILFGLSMVIAYCKQLPAEYAMARSMINNLYFACKERGWGVSDHQFKTHGSSAWKLDAPLRLLLKTLKAVANGEPEKHREWMFIPVAYLSFYYNTFIQNAYSHQLNAMVAHCLYLFRSNHLHAKHVYRWKALIYKTINKEFNPFWELLLVGNVSTKGFSRFEFRLMNPYQKFFSWNKYEKELTPRVGTNGPELDSLIVGWWILEQRKYGNEY